MLFNSYHFIFVFLPVVLLVFFRIGGMGHHRVAIAWLVAASLFFYGWWNPVYVSLIIGSMLVNFAIGIVLVSRDAGGSTRRKIVMAGGVAANLCLLAYYKYANFFVDNLNTIAGLDIHLEHIVLPLAISFFTFQQIAYLVDTYRGETREYNFLQYCLFVSFFPQLIAGPIVHHREMLPQFNDDSIYRPDYRNIAIGMTIFFIGLFKKVVIADGVAGYATPVFAAAGAGVEVTFIEAWVGALAYTMQLYFDFSGYADMAIGIARMFGIKLPLNFNSPYKAGSIIDFWRRWHMTLSRFLRDYIYFALGGNRKGVLRRHVNLLTTMLLGGLWHGAGWTFIFWGALHGVYLVVNHVWRGFCEIAGISRRNLFYSAAARLLTFLAVVVSWVFFRAEDMSSALTMLNSMSGGNGVVVPASWLQMAGPFGDYLTSLGVEGGVDVLVSAKEGLAWIIVLLAVVWYMPNTQQVMSDYEPAFEIYPGEIEPLKNGYLRWKPSLYWLFAVSLAATVSVFSLVRVSEFLYFQF